MSTTFLLAARISLATACLLGVGDSAQGILLAAAGYNPANLVLTNNPTASPGQTTSAASGQKLFLKNCAHCHGADGHGDDGPDLHNLDWTDEQIASRIRLGKKGQMTAFAGKLSADEIRAVIGYLHTLR